MTGNDRRGLVLQPRDRRLLETLAQMRVVDREQAKTVAGFGSVSRVNVRLLALTRRGLLRHFFLGSAVAGRRALYALSSRGARAVGVFLRGPRRTDGELLTTNAFVEHQLIVNDIRCALEFGPLPREVAFRRWLPFFAPLPRTRLVPDGYVEVATRTGTLAAFVEVDLGHESLAIWRRKVKSYLDHALSGDHAGTYGQPSFRVLVIASSGGRLQSLRDAVAKITSKLFWFADLPSVRTHGLLAPIWHRPTQFGNEPRSLLL